MTPKEKARELVNEKYYQPLTLHLNLNNNSKQMWAYAKICANIAVDEKIETLLSVIGGRPEMYSENEKQLLQELNDIKKEITLS